MAHLIARFAPLVQTSWAMDELDYISYVLACGCSEVAVRQDVGFSWCNVASRVVVSCVGQGHIFVKVVALTCDIDVLETCDEDGV